MARLMIVLSWVFGSFLAASTAFADAVPQPADPASQHWPWEFEAYEVSYTPGLYAGFLFDDRLHVGAEMTMNWWWDGWFLGVVGNAGAIIVEPDDPSGASGTFAGGGQAGWGPLGVELVSSVQFGSEPSVALRTGGFLSVGFVAVYARGWFELDREATFELGVMAKVPIIEF